MRRGVSGCFVALPTPFRNGGIDYTSLSALIERQVEGGADGLVVVGTTGEAATLTTDERRAVIEFSTGTVRGRVPVYAGVGTNCTAQTVELARAAEAARADGLLVVTPYYNKPTQRGLQHHFGQVAGASTLPLMLYNVPSRTAVDLLPETVGLIAREHANVVAVKETICTEKRIRALSEESGLDVFSGEDARIADCMQWGGRGTVSVVANLFPAEVAELVRTAVPGGDEQRAAELVELLAPIIRCLFLETNPAPLKAALSLLGLCEADLRAPLVPVEPGTSALLAELLGGGPRS